MGSKGGRGHREYLTEEVKDSLAATLDDHSDFSEETAHEVFRAECEKFEELFQDDTPKSAIQRVALNQTKKRLKDGELPEKSDRFSR